MPSNTVLNDSNVSNRRGGGGVSGGSGTNSPNRVVSPVNFTKYSYRHERSGSKNKNTSNTMRGRSNNGTDEDDDDDGFEYDSDENSEHNAQRFEQFQQKRFETHYPMCAKEIADSNRAEASYKKFFRLLSVRDPYLDRLSLLACHNQGLDPAADCYPVAPLDLFAAEFYKTHPTAAMMKSKHKNENGNSNTNNNSKTTSAVSNPMSLNGTINMAHNLANSNNSFNSTTTAATAALGGGGQNQSSRQLSPLGKGTPSKARPKRDAFDPFIASHNANANTTRGAVGSDHHRQSPPPPPLPLSPPPPASSSSVRASSAGGLPQLVNPPSPSSTPLSKETRGNRQHNNGERDKKKNATAKNESFGGGVNDSHENTNQPTSDDDDNVQQEQRYFKRRERLLNRLAQDPPVLRLAQDPPVLVLRLAQDPPVLVVRLAHEMKIQRQLVNIKIASKERAKLSDLLLRHADERFNHELLENEMMHRPKRKRAIIPAILLSHEENTLHAQLTAQESAEQKQKRQHILELRKAMLLSDATVDEAIGDVIPGGNGGGNDATSRESEELDAAIARCVRKLEGVEDNNETEGDGDDILDRDGATTTAIKQRASSSASSPPSPPSLKVFYARDPIERDAIRSLLNVQSGFQEAEAKFEQDMAQTAIKGQHYIENIRRRHMNTMVTEINNIQQRESMLKHLAAREEAWKQMQNERKRELHERVVAADMLRNEKMALHEAEAERVAKEKKDRFQSKIDERDERLAAIEAENERERIRRNAAMEKSMEENRKRLSAREQEREAKRQLLKEETAAKLNLHGARKTNLTVRRDVLLATQAQQSARKQREALHRREHRYLNYAQALEESIQERMDVVAQRRQQHIKKRLELFQKANETIAVRTEEAELRREDNDAFREQWCEAVDEHREEKLRCVSELQRQKEESYALRQEMTALKEEEHLKVINRLKKVRDYNQSVRKAVVDAQIAHNETRKRAADQHREELRRNRIAMAHKQEIIHTSIKAMVDGNKFAANADRETLEKCIDDLAPENQRKKHQTENARRELKNAKKRLAATASSASAATGEHSHASPSPSPTAMMSRNGRNNNGANSPIAALPPSRLTLLYGYNGGGASKSLLHHREDDEDDGNEQQEEHAAFTSPVDEIIKRIRRSR